MKCFKCGEELAGKIDDYNTRWMEQAGFKVVCRTCQGQGQFETSKMMQKAYEWRSETGKRRAGKSVNKTG